METEHNSQLTGGWGEAGGPLPELLRASWQARPDAPGVYIDGRWLTRGELDRRVDQAANALAAQGVTVGSRLGTLLPNNEPLVLTWLAAMRLNATLVPVNVNLIGESLRYIVRHADLDLLLVDASVLGPFREAFGETSAARRLLVHGADLSGAGRWEDLLAQAPDTPVQTPTAPGDLALILYTSGTTGLPKGVMLSRAAQTAHGWHYGTDFVRLGPGETGYTCLPLFHVTAMGFSLGCWLGGAAIAIAPRFNPFGFWDEIRRHGARMFPYLGAMIALLAARPPSPTDAAVPAVRAVGAATPIDLWEPFERRFGLTLIETYGQTETTSLWFMPPLEGRKVGSMGKPASRLDAKITGWDDTALGPDTVGELVLRPHNPLLMTSGYFRNPEATAAAFRNGWYHTGDAASIDADGYYYFRGRLKDFIRRRGENISAFEIEREALAHPAVREAAAVGIPSSLGEEEIKLCVVPHSGQALDPAELARHLRPRLAPFMRPRYIQVRADFPRTATQRIQKFRLVEEGVPPGTWDRQARRHGRG